MSATRVIIVGAGAAGIAAASRLMESGINDVLLLEATNRIGGRIYTTDFGDGIIEMGAQWVHGEKGNAIFEMANPLNLLSDSVTSLMDSSTFFVKPSGELLKLEDIANVIGIITEIDQKSDEDLKTWDRSLGDYFTEEFWKYIKENSELNSQDSDLAGSLLEWYEKLENSIDGSDSWFETSGKGLTVYKECEGNLLLHWKNGGYRTVIDLLMKKFPDAKEELPVMNKILLNKEVTNIVWDSSSDDSHQVMVHCSDSSMYNADHVIVTLSLGVLKDKAEFLFKPTLTEEKLRSIKGLSIGTVNKIFLKFPHRWWPSDIQGFNLLWTKENKANFRLENKKKKRDKSWLEGIFGFYAVDGQPNVLCGWIVGGSARHMEQIRESEVLEDVMELLEVFLGKSYNIPHPDELKRSTWTADPYFRGSYSYRSMETEKLRACASSLASPILNSKGKHVVLFAGEATHDHFYSTVHGAIETGWREADRIINLHRRKPPLYKVAIIGAGISGLAAARTLVKEGVTNVIILEAQDYAGGRIKSIPLEDGWVEVGAQWIHGQNNEVWRLASQKHLLSDIMSSEGEGLYIREDGVLFEPALVHEVYSVVAGILEECEHIMENTEKGSVMPTSVGQYLREKFCEYLDTCITDNQDIKVQKLQLYDWHVRFHIVDNSCVVLDMLSAKAWGKYVFCGGTDYMNFKDGYSSLIKAIVSELPESVLKLKCPVRKIIWKKKIDSNFSNKINICNGIYKEGICNKNNCFSNNSCNGFITKTDYESDFDHSNEDMCDIPVTIECNDTVIHAEHAIITCSLGYLKKNSRSMFIPKLPHATQQAIEDLGFSAINKIFLAFSEPWWSVDTKGFQLLWFANKSHLSASEVAPWTRDLTGFDVLPNHKAVLLGWIGGHGAELVEQYSEEEIGDHCIQLLRIFTKNPNIPKPHTVIRSSWHGNPYIHGGYSNTTILCDASNVGPSTLSRPICADISNESDLSVQEYPVLLFAGEATHENFFSTTHGAYETGQRQAEALVNFLKSQTNVPKQNHSQ